ncbi:MAG: HlyD family efflux transporter periplasmic adaptor subunit [Planctomycetaceae bacterium]
MTHSHGITAGRRRRVLIHRVRWCLATVVLTAVIGMLTGAVERHSAPLDIGVTTVEPSSFRMEIQRPGIVEPLKSQAVHSDCYWTTRILSIVPEGTWVQAGDVVCVMDSADIEEYARTREVLLIRYRGRLDNALHEQEMLTTQSERLLTAAEHRLATAENNLDEYQHGTFPQQVEQLEQDLSIASRQLATEADKVSGVEQMWAMGLVDSRQMSRSSATLLNVRQKHDVLQSKLNLLTGFTHPRTQLQLAHTRSHAQRTVARTMLSNSLAETRAQLTTLAYEKTVRIYERYYQRAIDSIKACTLRAPCDGQVMYGNSWYLKSRGITQIEEGATVRQLQKVFEIPDLRHLKVSIPIDEALIYRIHKDMPVSVTPAGYDDQKVAGRIVEISKYPRPRSSYTPGVKDYWIDIQLLPTEAQASLLKMRSDVTVTLTLHDDPEALQIPRTAVTGIAGHNFVFVFDGHDLQSRPVELGQANESSVCIVAGLSSGEQVVTAMTDQHRKKLEDVLEQELRLGQQSVQRSSEESD